MASSIPAVRAWLVNALQAETANDLGGVLIVRTGTWDETPDRERVEVRNARDIRREWRGAFGMPLTETYTVPIYIETSQRGGQLDDVEARLWDLVTTVERLVAASRTLDGLVIAALPAGSPDGPESGAASQADYAARITIEIAVEAVVDLS